MIVDHVPGTLTPGVGMLPNPAGHQILGVRTGNVALVKTLQR